MVFHTCYIIISEGFRRMGKERVKYIDLMKGLSITWMVWFHTIHPDFVNYGFRMPLFFIASAIFFKPYSIKEFAEKKIYQIIVPFIFFYILYYGFMILTSCVKGIPLQSFNFGCFFEIFEPNVGNGGPTVNPPMWFIMAILNLQILLYLCVKIIKRREILMLVAFIVSLIASIDLFWVPTYFQFGRALRYFVYYAFGYAYGKDLISVFSHRLINKFAVSIFAAVLWIGTMALKSLCSNQYLQYSLEFIQIGSFVVLLMGTFSATQNWMIWKPLKYYGASSYIVLGMNEMILSSLRGWMIAFLGPLTIFTGIINWLLTMLVLIPVINSMNHFIPWLVGKENPFGKVRNIVNARLLNEA